MSASALAVWLGLLQLAGLAVLGLAALGDRLARRRSAATRRGLWALAIVLASTLPLARLALPIPALALPSALAVALVGLWSLGAGLLLLRWWVGAREARELIAGATPIIAGPWRESLDDLAVDPKIDLRMTAAGSTAMLVGSLRPTILIPAALAEAAAAERRSILTHELAHVARADTLLLHLGVLVRAIYWITPLSWWALRRLRDEAENAADDAVLEAGMTPTSYAAQLVASARAQLDRAGRVAARQLRERVEAILDGSRRREPVGGGRPHLAVARLLTAAVLLASLATACEARSDDREAPPPMPAAMQAPAQP